MPVKPVDYKISLLGPVPYDHITLWNNELVDRYGCLVYPAIALSKLLGRKARITHYTQQITRINSISTLPFNT